MVSAIDASEQERPEVIYDLKLVGIPVFKGLTAFALACTQEGLSAYSNKKLRNFFATAHSIVRLGEEYVTLPAHSSYYRKLVVVGLLFFVVPWLLTTLYDPKVIEAFPMLRLILPWIPKVTTDTSPEREEGRETGSTQLPERS